jgi:hypothetical protein
VTLGLVWSAAALTALAAWQLAMLAAMVALLLRERGGLGAGERRTADTFALALLLTLPLAATDFSALLPDAAVRGGPFAVLILVLATSRAASGTGSPEQLLADIAVAAGAGGAAVLVGLAVAPQLGGAAGGVIAAGGGAVAALLLLVERAREARREQHGLVAALARAPAAELATAHPLLADARLLGPAELVGYPAASVARLAAERVVSAESGDAELRDAARDLLDAHAATHVLRVSRDPPRFLAVAAGGLAGPGLDDALAVAARLIEGAR